MAVYYFPVSSSISGRTANYYNGPAIGNGTLDGSPIYGYCVTYQNSTTTSVRKLYIGGSVVNSLKLGSNNIIYAYIGNKMVFGTQTQSSTVRGYIVYPCYAYMVQGQYYTAPYLSTPQECAEQMDVSIANVQYGVTLQFESGGQYTVDLYINGTKTTYDYNIGGHQNTSGTQFIYNNKVVAIYNTNDTSYINSITDSNHWNSCPRTVKIPPKTMLFYNLTSSSNTSSSGTSSYYDCKIVITTQCGLVLTMPLDFTGLTSYYAK